MEQVRLNKYLSEKGILSRREADRYTEEGKILVDGHVALLGEKVSDENEILVDGKLVQKGAPQKVILALHKPVGVVCTTRSFPGETNVVELVSYKERLYPVGRLDKDSEGLILLTNHGAFSEEATKASGHHEKEYEVTVQKPVTKEFISRMEKGLYLPELEKTTAPCKVLQTGVNSFNIVLTQGLNRQIRRMCQELGYEVQVLKRVRFMNVQLGDLPAGQYREIQGNELVELLKGVGL